MDTWNTLAAIAQQDYLAKLSEEGLFQEHPCHIYMIARAPRIAIDLPSLKLDDTTLSGRFLIQHQNNFTPHEFVTPHNFGPVKATFESPYPHTMLTIRDEQGKMLLLTKSAHLVRMCPHKHWRLLDLEVMYVGQSYGVDGARTAPDRLLKHETLQAIYAEAVQHAPDKDIWLVLWSFDDQILASFDGRSREYEMTEEEDLGHLENVLHTPVSEQQKINFTEASLIRYFQPEYNQIYKNTFPNPAHVTYSECYDLDINSVSFNLDSETTRSRLWSPQVKPSYVHFAQFNLHSPDERRSMFDLPE